MRLYLEGKLFGTENPRVYIDFIEIKTPYGNEIVIDWDESGWDSADGNYYATYKGVYFNEVYANGCIDLLRDGFEITGIQFYDMDIEKETDGEFGVVISCLTFDDNGINLEFKPNENKMFMLASER